MSYKIVCKTQGWLAACDFHSLERAQAWIDKFDASRYMDKTLKKEDFEIQEEKRTERQKRIFSPPSDSWVKQNYLKENERDALLFGNFKD